MGKITALEMVHETDIYDVISLENKLSRKGANYQMLCPFHSDSRLGSFVVSPIRNRYTCFACGESGDGIDFIKNTKDMSYKQAVQFIAENLGYVEEGESVFKNKKGGNQKIFKNLKEEKRRKKEELERVADIENLNKVYQEMTNFFGLSEEDRQYLNQRGIANQLIERNKYFSLPKTNYMIEQFIKTLINKGISTSYVPGFYEFKNTTQTTMLYGKRGIGIPMMDAKRRIVSIQFRMLEENSDFDLRYFFLSSVGRDKGAKSNASLDVNYPSKINNNSVFVTEGNFKGIVLSEFTSSTAISLQGVNSYVEGEFKSVFKGINENYSLINREVRNVVIAYDADWVSNEAVRESLEVVVNFFINETGFDVYLALWDEKYGKGIDDVIVNGNASQLKTYTVSEWEDIKRDIDNQLAHSL